MLRLSRSFALPLSALKPAFSSPQAACAAPAPSRSRLVVDRVVRGAALPGGPRGNQGGLHPSPPAPLPFQRRGVPCEFFTAWKNSKSSPRPRHGGEVSGVRGQWHPCHRKQTRESGKERTPGDGCDSSVPIGVHPWLKKTPLIGAHPWLHTRASRGVSPLSPSPSPLPGARGAAR